MEYVKLGEWTKVQRDRVNTKLTQAVEDRTWQGPHEGTGWLDEDDYLLRLHNAEAPAATTCYHQMREHRHPRRGLCL